MGTTAFLGPLHPRHGIHEPTSGTPERAPRSVRRTVTTDMLRPDGVEGPLLLVGSGRDLRTGADGTPVELARAAYTAQVDFTGGWILQELTTAPPRPSLRSLTGEGVGSGFRARVLAADPDLPSLLHQLMDDVPVTTLVSGHAYMAGRSSDPDGPQELIGRPDFGRDMCAGFADGGTIMNSFDATGRGPLVTGPEALPLATSDPWAWHELPPLPAHGMRRHRRMDVTESGVDVLFRDSYMGADGRETVIHEYTVDVEFDGDRIRSCEATPRALPWVECPAAVASAGRLAGLPLAGLRGHVRRTFTGTSTCTHLNDTLRALEDAPFLRDAIA